MIIRILSSKGLITRKQFGRPLVLDAKGNQATRKIYRWSSKANEASGPEIKAKVWIPTCSSHAVTIIIVIGVLLAYWNMDWSGGSMWTHSDFLQPRWTCCHLRGIFWWDCRYSERWILTYPLEVVSYDTFFSSDSKSLSSWNIIRNLLIFVRFAKNFSLHS